MAQTRVVLRDWLVNALNEIRPPDMDLSDQVHFVIVESLGGLDTLATLTERAGEQPESAVSKESSSKKKNSHIRKIAESVPNDLKWCEFELQTFWDHKSGVKTQAALDLLLAQVRLIAEKYNRQTVHEQLALGTANSWQSVTLAGYEKFGMAKSATTTQAEAPKSNAGAYRDFTAERLERERSEALLDASPVVVGELLP